MKSKDIIKSLERCTEKGCNRKCQLYDETHCEEKLMKNALDLIKNQQAEIERLNENYQSLIAQEEKSNQFCKNVCEPKYKAEIERLQNAYKQCAWERDVFEKQLETDKTEAYKEFADKLNEYKHECGCNYRKKCVFAVTEEKIQFVLQELTERKED